MMTKPAVYFFGYDTSPGRPDPKVFFRSLLYSTSKRGQLIESMFLRVQRGESAQNFSIWVYGERADLKRGSGLFVSEDGVAANHHFLLAPDQAEYIFQPGTYSVEVHALVVGRKEPRLLQRTELSVSALQAEALGSRNSGVYFDWSPDAGSYYSHVDRKHNPSFKGALSSLVETLPSESDSLEGK